MKLTTEASAMAHALVVRFSTRPGMQLEHSPPARPPWRKGLGDYCLKATCDVLDEGGFVTARVVGYDRYVSIARDVENACVIRAGGQGRCSPARVAMLSEYRKECSGEVYFVIDGTSKRVV